jgi:hypothetical protein
MNKRIYGKPKVSRSLSLASVVAQPAEPPLLKILSVNINKVDQ